MKPEKKELLEILVKKLELQFKKKRVAGAVASINKEDEMEIAVYADNIEEPYLVEFVSELINRVVANGDLDMVEFMEAVIGKLKD